MKFIAGAVAAVLLALAGTSAVADEQTGREFSELVRELNKELADAKAKVRVLEEKHQANVKTDALEVLPERQKALKDLQGLTQQLKKAPNDRTKKDLEGKVQDQVIRVAELSADFLENHKDELVNQDKQLEVIENALGKVILKLDRLKTLAEKSGEETTKEDIRRQKTAARRELQGMARMVEVLAKNNPKSQHWNSVRQTILLQDAVLQRGVTDSSRLQDMLEVQKQVYEQTHTQIVLARRGIAEERKLVAQVALGEVARSMLRKAAGLLLGSHQVENIGEATLAKVDLRKKSLLQFLDQDQGVDQSFDVSGSIGNNDAPSGYEDYLKKDIN